MMNIGEVLEGFRALLDSDPELRIALGVNEGDTKVFLRNTLPQDVNFPCILISDFANVPTPGFGQPATHWTAAIDISIHTKQNADGSDAIVQTYQILNVIMALVYAANATTASCKYNSFRLTQAQAAQSLDGSSVKVVTFQGYISEVA